MKKCSKCKCDSSELLRLTADFIEKFRVPKENLEKQTVNKNQ